MYYTYSLLNGYFVECKPGFIGSNCAISCPYPSYGEQCQGICDCDKNNCDVSTGCKRITTGTHKTFLSPQTTNYDLHKMALSYTRN